MELSGWGKYPVIDAEVIQPLGMDNVLQSISGTPHKSVIARGLGRSYGDSSLPMCRMNSEHRLRRSRALLKRCWTGQWTIRTMRSAS